MKNSNNINPRPFKNRFFNTILASLFCWACIFIGGPLLGFILHPLEKFNPLTRWEDIELSDLYYSYFSKAKTSDQNIVLLDCSDQDRNGIAKQIEMAINSGAKVIGVDVQFDGSANTSGTAYLKSILTKYSSKVVLALDHKDTGINKMNLPFYIDLMTDKNPLPNFGYIQMSDSCKVLRTFTPYIEYSGSDDTDTSFEVKILTIWGGNSAIESLNSRNKAEEIVHFRKVSGYDGSDINRYPVYKTATIPGKDSLNGKIVLVGDYDASSLMDLHYSPMNARLQRSYPDLKGVEFHAHILSTIINGDYINELKFKKLWVFLFCMLGVFFFLPILHKPLFHIYLDIIVLCISPIIMIISILLLKYSDFKIEPVDFIVPLFLTGLFLHLYDYLLKKNLTKKIFAIFNRKRNIAARRKTAISTVLILFTLVTYSQNNTVAATFSDIKVDLMSGEKLQNLKSGSSILLTSIIEIRGRGKIIFIRYDGLGCVIPVYGFSRIRIDTLRYTAKSPSTKSMLLNFLRNYVHKPKRMSSSSTHKGGKYNNYPMLFPADNELLLNSEITFLWLKDSRVQYEFVLEKGDDMAMPIKYLVDTSLCFNTARCINRYSFKNELDYYWTIQDTQSEKDSVYLLKFNLANKTVIEQLNNDLSGLETDKVSLDNELYYCLKANIYENHKMYSEANRVFQDAIKENPSFNLIRDVYQRFIFRVIGLNQKPD